MSVLLWYTASDYPFNIFKLLYHDRPILLTIVLNTSMFVDSWCFRTDATNGVVESSRHRCNWNGVSMWESCYNFRKGIVIYIYFNTVVLRVMVIIFNAHFNNIVSYIMVVSFIGGGNRSIQRKPLTCRKSLTNLITKCCIKYTSQL